MVLLRLDGFWCENQTKTGGCDVLAAVFDADPTYAYPTYYIVWENGYLRRISASGVKIQRVGYGIVD